MTINIPDDQAGHAHRTREAYDRLAAVWSATTDDGPFNGYLERPAIRALIPGSLKGTVVLDAGCGSGAQAQWLLDQGADVVGIGVSPRMIEEPGRRCGENGQFLVADLAKPLQTKPCDFSLTNSPALSECRHSLFTGSGFAPRNGHATQAPRTPGRARLRQRGQAARMGRYPICRAAVAQHGASASGGSRSLRYPDATSY